VCWENKMCWKQFMFCFAVLTASVPLFLIMLPSHGYAHTYDMGRLGSTLDMSTKYMLALTTMYTYLIARRVFSDVPFDDNDKRLSVAYIVASFVIVSVPLTIVYQEDIFRLWGSVELFFKVAAM